MKKPSILFTLILCLFSLLACAQEEMIFRSISIEQGLSNASVRRIYRDGYGFIWIGTRGGLNRFDGNQIVQYLNSKEDSTSLNYDYVSAIHQLSDDHLLIGTFTGLEVYSYHTKRFHRFPDSRLQEKRIFDIDVDVDGALWISTNDGLYHLKDSTLDEFSHDPSNRWSISDNYCFTTESDERFLYVSTNSGLNILDKQTLRFRNSNNDDHPVFKEPGSTGYSILKSSDGFLWFGSAKKEGGVLLNRFDLSSEDYASYTVGDNGLSLFFAVLAIHEDQSGGLYFGMNGGGFYRYDEEANWFYNYTHDPKDENSIGDVDVWDIYSDKNSNLWIGTDGGGLSQHNSLFGRFKQYRHNPFDEKSLGVDDTHDFFEDERYLWVGNNTLGLSRLEKATGTFHNYPFTADEAKSLLDYTVFAVEGDEAGNIWVGSYEGGLSKLNPNTGRFTHIVNRGSIFQLPSNYIGEIVHKDGVLWLGTAEGLGMHDINKGETKVIRRVPKDPAGFSDVIDAICFEGDSVLWAGSRNGLFRIDTKSLKIDSTNTELDTVSVNALAISNAEFWVGTTSGLAKYRKGFELEWITTSDGLSSNNVLGIELDQLGRVWCITNNGLNLINPESKAITTFSTKDGLTGNQFNMGSIYRGKNSIFYAGSVRGFNSWDPAMVQLESNKPVVVFTDLIIRKESLTRTRSLVDQKETILEDDDDYLTIHFFSDEIVERSKTKFAYRIREFSTSNWIEIDEWKVDLTDLRPGSYTLDVKASNYDGFYGDPSSLLIRIKPPIWATTYAYAFYGLVILGLFVLRDRYLKLQRKRLEETVVQRTKEISEQKELAERDKAVIEDQNKVIAKSLEERESLLKEIHHRVKNNLQIIASLLYLQSGKFEDEDYKKVLEEGQGRVRSMALIHQKLYENDDLKSIPFEEYLQELVSEIRGSFGTSMSNIELHVSAANIYFDVDTAVPLGLIVNELATNAFKYAFSREAKGSFSIFLKGEGNKYYLTIKDDGRGLPPEIDIRKSKSLGLRLVRMLSQQLEGDFQITREGGTTFELRFAA